MNIIFMGTPDYAHKILQKLIDNDTMNVVAVYTQPDKPVGRKKILTAPPVKELAVENAITVYQPKSLRDEESIAQLQAIACDFIVVAAYGQILPKAVLEHAPSINLHASILPKYRGASPIQQVLLNGEKQTGVTAMLMDEGLDTGDILKIVKVDIADDEMAEELFVHLRDVAADLTIDVLENFSSLSPMKQDETAATYCKKITKADGEVTLENAEEVYNKYRAFTPWPGIYLASGLKLKKISLEDKSTAFNTPGKIIAIAKDSITVACNRGALKIYRVQPNSKKEMDIAAYVNGKRVSVEDYLT